MNGSCHCGRIIISVPGRPSRLNACNCSVCLKLGTLWGYYPATQVEVKGKTRSYRREDVDRARLSFAFCDHCGATANWSLLADDAEDRVGVNMRLFDPTELKGVEVQYGDRRNHEAGVRHFYREPTIFDGAGAQP